MPKPLTAKQRQGRKDKAVRFTRDVLHDGDRADEIEAERLEDYAERKGIQLSNPRCGGNMARAKTVADYRQELKELKEQVSDLEEENETLQDQLDSVADIVGGEDGDDEDDDEDDDAEVETL